LMRARDLKSAMSLASHRYGRFLSADGRNRFEEAYGQSASYLDRCLRMAHRQLHRRRLSCSRFVTASSEI
jgi:hypothetical protein